MSDFLSKNIANNIAKHINDISERQTENTLRNVIADITDEKLKLISEVERLEAENAALRERLGKAVELPFIVIDKKTGKEADEYEITLHEDWAKHLMYCDMEGFAIEQDGTLILLDECGQFVYCSSDRFEVVPEARLAELKGEEK